MLQMPAKSGTKLNFYNNSLGEEYVREFMYFQFLFAKALLYMLIRTYR